MNIDKSLQDLKEKGYLDLPFNPSLDLFSEIERIKKQKNAIILAHYYQDPDIQDIADFIGDSLGLAQQAKKTDASLILFAGVHFMAETAKILNPDKKVIIPDLKAGCSLADSAQPEEFRKFKNYYPDHLVISYINCTAEIKALSDIICTSSNAEFIIRDIPENKGIIFAPDKNLGAYLRKLTKRDLVLWNGACQVHEIFNLQKIIKLKVRFPAAKFIAHPECEQDILQIADYIGSTTALLKFTQKDHSDQYIVATESGIIHQMQRSSPNKTFIPAPPTNNCMCNECPYMRLNTLEKIYISLREELPEVTIDEAILEKARLPIDRMLSISTKYGL